jgi:CubicO group peptidase (beta-lactamase class C family)
LESGLLRRVDEIVDDAVRHDDAPGVVAAVATADTVHVAIAGVMTLGGESMAPDTLFQITSMTKPTTATAVLALVDSGRKRVT